MYKLLSARRLAARAQLLAKLAPPRGGCGSGVLRLQATAPAPCPAPRFVIAGIETSCDDTGVALLSFAPREGPADDAATTPAAAAPPLPELSSAALLSHVLSSQHHLHAPYAGIVPTIASRAHAEALPWVWRQAVAEAAGGAAVPATMTAATAQHPGEGSPPPLRAVAVTTGPGLSMCLRVGLSFARGDEAATASGATAQPHRLPPGLPPGTPLVPVNHLEGHLLIPRYVYGPSALPFPYLVLLVSGGHTLIALARGVGAYTVLGSTLDDSLGECFDKVARMVEAQKHAAALGVASDTHLGALLEALALRPGANPRALRLPVPLRGAPAKAYPTPHAAVERFEKHRPLSSPPPSITPSSSSPSPPPPVVAFSFSGLKSAVQRYVTRPGVDVSDASTACNIAASFHAAVSQHCSDQLLRALAHLDAEAGNYDPDAAAVTTVVVCGGAARNSILRSALTATIEGAGRRALFPPPGLCTDNGVMVAWAGAEVLAAGVHRELRGVAGEKGLGGEQTAQQQLLELDVNPRWRLGSPPPVRLLQQG